MKTVFKTLAIILLSLLCGNIKGQINHFSIQNKGMDNQITNINIDSAFYSSTMVCGISGCSFSGLSLTATINLYGYERKKWLKTVSECHNRWQKQSLWKLTIAMSSHTSVRTCQDCREEKLPPIMVTTTCQNMVQSLLSP